MSFFKQYCILSKNDSLLPILRFPGYFETPLFRTFFHFPWDFEIAGFNCTHNWWMDFFPRAHALSDFFKVTDNETISRQNFWPCCNVFTSSKKHEIRRFHVAVVQDGREMYKKSVMHVQGCCFANLTLLLFSCSHCRRRRRYCISCLCLDDRSTLGTKITCFPSSLGTRSVFTTFETRWRLSRV